MKHRGALKGYSFSEFSKVLSEKGFLFHHKNSTHSIFANNEGYYVTVPHSNRKEINHMMTTVTLQRIKNNQCRKL